MLDKLFNFAKKLTNPSTFQLKYRRNANGVEMVYIYTCIKINDKWFTYSKQVSLKTAQEIQDKIIEEIIKNTFEKYGK